MCNNCLNIRYMYVYVMSEIHHSDMRGARESNLSLGGARERERPSIKYYDDFRNFSNNIYSFCSNYLAISGSVERYVQLEILDTYSHICYHFTLKHFTSFATLLTVFILGVLITIEKVFPTSVFFSLLGN